MLELTARALRGAVSPAWWDGQAFALHVADTAAAGRRFTGVDVFTQAEVYEANLRHGPSFDWPEAIVRRSKSPLHRCRRAGLSKNQSLCQRIKMKRCFI